MESYLLYGLLLIVCVVAVYYRLRQARFRKRDPNMARYLDAVESAEARRRVETRRLTRLCRHLQLRKSNLLRNSPTSITRSRSCS